MVTLGPGHADESERLRASVEGTRVTRVWDGNGYMVWLAWVCAATAIAIDFVPRITWLKSVAWNGLGEGLILLVAILLLVQSQELPGSFFLQNLAGLLVFATVGFPLVALWRNTGAAPPGSST